MIQSNTEAFTVTTEIRLWTGIQKVQFCPCIKHPPVDNHQRLSIIPCKDTQSVVWDIKEKNSRTSVYRRKTPKLIQKIFKMYSPLQHSYPSICLTGLLLYHCFLPFPAHILHALVVTPFLQFLHHSYFSKIFRRKCNSALVTPAAELTHRRMKKKSLQYTRICSILIAKKTL